MLDFILSSERILFFINNNALHENDDSFIRELVYLRDTNADLKIFLYVRVGAKILRRNNLRIPGIQNTKFLVYYFYMYAKIYEDFQICNSVPLIWS